MNPYVLHTDKSWGATQQDLAICFERWGVVGWETNYPRGARLEGYSQSEQDRTVILTYTKNGASVRLVMGRQQRAQDNLRVLYLAVEAMRLNEKRGIADIVAEAYVQLAPGRVKKDPYEVLGVRKDAPMSVIEASYRARVKDAHPDSGGTPAQFAEIQNAIKDIRLEKGGEQ